MCVHTNHLRILSKGRFWVSRCGERPEICISNKHWGDAADAASSLFHPSPSEWKMATLPWLMLLVMEKRNNGAPNWHCILVCLYFPSLIYSNNPRLLASKQRIPNPEGSHITSLWFCLLHSISLSTLRFDLFLKINLWTINFWILRYGWYKRP